MALSDSISAVDLQLMRVINLPQYSGYLSIHPGDHGSAQGINPLCASSKVCCILPQGSAFHRHDSNRVLERQLRVGILPLYTSYRHHGSNIVLSISLVSHILLLHISCNLHVCNINLSSGFAMCNLERYNVSRLHVERTIPYQLRTGDNPPPRTFSQCVSAFVHCPVHPLLWKAETRGNGCHHFRSHEGEVALGYWSR